MTKITEASDFLEALLPDGPWAVAAKQADGGMQGIVFDMTKRNTMRKYVRDRVANHNLYFNANQTRTELPSGRAKKDDIVAVQFVHLDIDPAEDVLPVDYAAWREQKLKYLTEPLKGIPAPTHVINSGNGLQALWKLTEPTTEFERVEEANRWLIDIYYGDAGTFDVSRLLRLPNTVNIPGVKKRNLGRTEQPTDLLLFDSQTTYRLESFGRGEVIANKPAALGDTPMPEIARIADAVRTNDLFTLQAEYPDVLDRVWVIVNNGRNPNEPPKENDDTRSAWLFDAVCNLLRGGVPPEVILGLLMDASYGISESVLEAGRSSERYARSQIRKGQKRVELDKASTFKVDDKGKPYNSPFNYRVALQNLGVSVAKDVFNERVMISGLEHFGPRLDDGAVNRLRFTVEERFMLKANKDFMHDFLADEAEKCRFHPVKEYLDGLHWDGVPRIDDWLAAYCDAESTPYTRAVGRLLLVAAVRRISQPGAKFDEMVVLESEQGTQKSTLLIELIGNEDWFTDELPLGGDGKQIMEATVGKWVVEAAELVGQTAKSAEHLKSMLSRRVDRGRPAYGRISVEKPREFVIVGTTNKDRYLKDATGNRRYWPVTVGQVDIDGIRQVRDQLWAEATHAEKAGESIRLDRSLWLVAGAQQASRQEENPYDAAFEAVLGAYQGRLLVDNIFQLLGVQRTHVAQTLIGQAAVSCGWEKKNLNFDGRRQKCYVRGDKLTSQIELRAERNQDGTWRVEAPAIEAEELPF